MNDQASTEVATVDAPYSRTVAAEIPIQAGTGVLFQSLPQLVEAAKLMARSDICVPAHCRDEAGICFAILMRTENWKLRDPFFVAEHSYVVEKSQQVDGQWQKVKTLAFDSSVFHAILLASGVLKGRPEILFEGEGDARVCIVKLHTAGATIAYRSPKFSDCHPGHVTKDGKKFVKGSPLWDRDPDQQHAYWAIRAATRRHFPDVVGGIYDRDEFEEMRDVSPPAFERVDNPLKDEPAKEGQGAVKAQAPSPGKGEGAKPAGKPASKAAGQAKQKGKIVQAKEPEAPKEEAGPAENKPQPAKASLPEPQQAAPQQTIPKTPEEYEARANKFIDEATSSKALKETWTAKPERELRGACRIVEEAFERLKERLDAKLKALEADGK